ncbi:MAG: 6-phosphogluconolactonase [Desulfovibrionaceae bacterium]|nr:6-phosphogluconolactonase [Desulfovibrionaceae bacterium]
MVGRSRSIHLSVHIHKNPAAMAERAAHIIAHCCEEAIAERGVFTIALSGGATPLPLYRLLAGSDWAERLPWEKINIYFVDERAVEPEDADSNFGMIRRELLAHVPATHYYRIKAEKDPVVAAQQYESLLRTDFALKDNELPRFDFILLGMGNNGHTGSISVGSPAAVPDQKRLVIDQYVPGRRYDRVTMTLPVLNNARCCLFLVTGHEKHEVLSQALDLLAPPRLSAQMVRPTFGELIWIVDEAAATGYEE